MLKEIVNSVNEEKYYYSWVGGSNDSKTVKTIKDLINGYDWYSNRIDDGGQHRAAVKSNQDIWKKLKKLGVTAIADSQNKVPYNGFDGLKDSDITKVEQ